VNMSVGPAQTDVAVPTRTINAVTRCFIAAFPQFAFDVSFPRTPHRR